MCAADDTGGGIERRTMDFFVASHGNWRTILYRLAGHIWATPQIDDPRCRYLSDR